MRSSQDYDSCVCDCRGSNLDESILATTPNYARKMSYGNAKILKKLNAIGGNLQKVA